MTKLKGKLPEKKLGYISQQIKILHGYNLQQLELL